MPPLLSRITPRRLPAYALNALGAAAYILWSLLSSAALQRAYRRLAGVDALRATARLFESRAGIVESTGADEPMQAWIGDELALAERLQSARDLIFDAPDNARSRRDTA